MTLSTLWGRLRKHNKRDYRQFQFVILFAEMLISSYLMTLFSPLVQKALPDGGDTIKVASLVFGIAVVGCLIFVWYAARLFLRYKSREIGVFLALGTEKNVLSRALSVELMKMVGADVLVGMAAGAVLSVIVGKVMDLVTAKVNDYKFAFSFAGFGTSVLFGVVLILMTLILARRAMGRTNIMDVINEQRKQEPIRKSVTKLYMISGFLCIIVGLFVAVALPGIFLRITDNYLGFWTNAFYLVAVFGMYRLLVYSISSHQRGRNPQKYYNNLLNYGILKFQGGSIVRNMLVIALLIIGGMFAATYVPLMTVGNLRTDAWYEDGYSYRYLKDGELPTEEEVHEMAADYGVEITDYREGEFIRVPGSSVNRDTSEDGRQLIEEFVENYAEYDCLSVAEYEALTGISLQIPEGGYYLITQKEATENIWYQFDDMGALLVQNEQLSIPMEYLGNTEYNALVINTNGLGSHSRFVVNDMDYARLKEGLPIQKMGTQVLFDSLESDGEIPFAAELFKRLVNGMSAEMNHIAGYNPMEERRVGAEVYEEMAQAAVVDPDVPAKEQDWCYSPLLTPLINQQTILGYSVKLMLFVYVAAICIAAVGIIGYSRSQSVGISNRQIFEDIKRLGTDRNYRIWLMKKQVQKVYVLPTILGIGLASLYLIAILFTNDGVLKSDEITVMVIIVVIAAVTALFQYVMYRVSVKSVEGILGLKV